MGKTQVEVFGRLALMCGECGERLTLADRVMEAPRTMRNPGG